MNLVHTNLPDPILLALSFPLLHSNCSWCFSFLLMPEEEAFVPLIKLKFPCSCSGYNLPAHSSSYQWYPILPGSQGTFLFLGILSLWHLHLLKLLLSYLKPNKTKQVNYRIIYCIICLTVLLPSFKVSWTCNWFSLST